MTVRDVAELRGQLRASAKSDRRPEEWLLVAFPAVQAVAELLPLIELADEGSTAQRMLAEHVRYRLGTHIAASLELLDTLERTYGLDGPIANGQMSNRDAQEAVQRLSDVVRRRDDGG